MPIYSWFCLYDRPVFASCYWIAAGVCALEFQKKSFMGSWPDNNSKCSRVSTCVVRVDSIQMHASAKCEDKVTSSTPVQLGHTQWNQHDIGGTTRSRTFDSTSQFTQRTWISSLCHGRRSGTCRRGGLYQTTHMMLVTLCHHCGAGPCCLKVIVVLTPSHNIKISSI
jgi:hypothetical protein